MPHPLLQYIIIFVFSCVSGCGFSSSANFVGGFILYVCSCMFIHSFNVLNFSPTHGLAIGVWNFVLFLFFLFSCLSLFMHSICQVLNLDAFCPWDLYVTVLLTMLLWFALNYQLSLYSNNCFYVAFLSIRAMILLLFVLQFPVFFKWLILKFQFSVCGMQFLC